MKKLLCVLLVLFVMTLALSGCQNSGSNSPAANNPSDGNEDQNPSDGNENQNPSGGNENQNPSGGNENQNPSDGNENQNPSGGNENQNPSGGNENQNPSDGNEDQNPSDGNENQNPSGGNENQNPSEPEPEKYTVKWIDKDGNVLFEQQLDGGEIPSYSYTVTDTAEWDYTFIGWAKTANGETLSEIPALTENTEYYAVVKAEKMKYTVTFNSKGGSEVSAQTVEYGTLAEIPQKPKLDGYKFIGWSTSDTTDVLVDFEEEITENTEYFAIWQKVVDVKALLKALLEGYTLNPLEYIPESMLAGYKANLVNADDIVTDYSSFVNVSDISYGYGEQWHMVIDNLEQSMLFFDVLSIVETVSTSSVTAFNNYFDENPDDTAHHEFAVGTYNVTISFDGKTIFYVLDFTADLPVFGTQTAQIALAMDSESGEKTARIQLGDANALTYTVRENGYEFAIKYLGVRRAMFSIAKDAKGNVSGKIYEYLTVSAVEFSSAADFYITDEYVSVIGNKADGIVGFTNYINELYSTDNGKLLGYEIKETLSMLTYNTLWFKLDDVSGISSIKYRPQTETEEEAFFVNGMTSAWQTKNLGVLGGKYFSRRFDIEFKTQYVYSYDEENDTYTEHKISVPMIFVQEEFYDDFVKDVKATNGITVSVSVSAPDLSKLLSDYDNLVPVFVENKDKITPDVIIQYIGEKIKF